MNDDVCILVPVWKDYQWLAPLTLELIEKHWPAHPPLFLAGLSAEEAFPAPHFPVSDITRRENWCWMVRDSVRQARSRYRRAYLIAEEHAPLARCHEWHLCRTIPDAMDDWNAVYISLMGWDNRRYASRNPILGPDRHRVMHLTRERAPRFHLHPALWRLDVLEHCCDISLANESRNGSAWHFEKTCEKFDAALPAEWKMGCYQVAAHTLSSSDPSAFRTCLSLSERWVFNRLMAVLPWIPRKAWADFYARAIAMDDVFCHGPYPMIFSGILQKGSLNRYLARHFQGTPDGRDLLARIANLHSSPRKA